MTYGEAARDLNEYFEPLQRFGLTRKEVEVARLLSWNHTYKEIAKIIHRSTAEAKRRGDNLRRKLGVANKRAAGAFVRDIVQSYRSG